MCESGHSDGIRHIQSDPVNSNSFNCPLKLDFVVLPVKKNRPHVLKMHLLWPKLSQGGSTLAVFSLIFYQNCFMMSLSVDMATLSVLVTST